MEIDCNPILSSPIRRAHGVSIRKGMTTTRQLPSVPGLERTEMPGDDGTARQCALVGNFLNDEQRSDNLSNPP